MWSGDCSSDNSHAEIVIVTVGTMELIVIATVVMMTATHGYVHDICRDGTMIAAEVDDKCRGNIDNF